MAWPKTSESFVRTAIVRGLLFYCIKWIKCAVVQKVLIVSVPSFRYAVRLWLPRVVRTEATALVLYNTVHDLLFRSRAAFTGSSDTQCATCCLKSHYCTIRDVVRRRERVCYKPVWNTGRCRNEMQAVSIQPAEFTSAVSSYWLSSHATSCNVSLQTNGNCQYSGGNSVISR